jgi:hypothetical protein
MAEIRTMRWLGTFCLAMSASVLIGSLAVAQESAETFGCEPNPTGDPIGGGPGYRDIKTGGDFTVRTADEFLAALARAKPGQVIWLPDGVEIDLGGRQEIPLPGGVTIAGTRGMGASPGARIFMKQKQKTIYYLFRTAGDNVRLTGIRLDGPDGDDSQRNGYSNLLRTEHYGLEVDKCEVANWGYSAVAGRLGAANLRIHHCYIHHCVGAAHDGYGVSLVACDAFIIANKFGWIRNHAISGDGRAGTSYEAAYNLLLPPRGNFDMHGGGDRGDGTNIGGDWISIHHNTFPMEDPRSLVLLRGVAAQGAEVHHNWFAAPVERAIGASKQALHDQFNVHVYRNVYGPGRTLEE